MAWIADPRVPKLIATIAVVVTALALRYLRRHVGGKWHYRAEGVYALNLVAAAVALWWPTPFGLWLFASASAATAGWSWWAFPRMVRDRVELWEVFQKNAQVGTPESALVERARRLLHPGG